MLLRAAPRVRARPCSLRPLWRPSPVQLAAPSGGSRHLASSTPRAAASSSIADYAPLAVAVGGGCLLVYGIGQAWPSNRMAGPRPTDPETLEKVLELLEEATPLGKAGARDKLFVDLGCGDGRVVVAAVARFGCRGVGVDVMEDSIATATNAARELPADVASQAAFLQADMHEVDLQDTDVLFIYLPQPILRLVVLNLLPRSGLRPGTLVLIEDTPKDFCRNAPSFGFWHLQHGGVLPPSSRYPVLDLFEWRGLEAERPERPLTPLERRKLERQEASLASKPKIPLWDRGAAATGSE